MLYGSQQNCTEMLPCDRSHQLGKGQSQCAGMSLLTRPSRPVYGSQPSVAAMPLQIRSQGKGHHRIAEMPSTGTPFPPVLGHVSIAEMPHLLRPILTRGQQRAAEMPSNSRLSREGSVVRRRNAIRRTPFPPVLGGSEETHSNVTGIALSHQLGEGQSSHAAMPCDDRPSRPVRKGHNLYANQAATVSPFPINLWEDHKAVAEMPL
jgi:hypothetical protein